MQRIMNFIPAPPPPGIDITTAAPARMYDYWLGGHYHFAAHRIAALQVTEAAPEAPLLAVENRGFLRRAVRYLAGEAGVSQFLDIGTGLPTRGNVHEVVQVPHWRPDGPVPDDASKVWLVGGVGRKAG
jgi:hypothetical protein